MAIREFDISFDEVTDKTEFYSKPSKPEKNIAINQRIAVPGIEKKRQNDSRHNIEFIESKRRSIADYEAFGKFRALNMNLPVCNHFI